MIIGMPNGNSVNRHGILCVLVVAWFSPAMETETVNIAVVPVISISASKEGLSVTKEQFDREKNYGAAMAVARAMLSNGIITQEEYSRIDAMFTEKYRPLIGSEMPQFA